MSPAMNGDASGSGEMKPGEPMLEPSATAGAVRRHG